MTTDKGESLYGAAPEGDEDPHASQAVPDPGESPSYSRYRVPFHAAQLDGTHVGRRMRVREQMGGGYASVYQGTLCGVEHGASKISETPLASGQAHWVLGQRWVRVSFLNEMHAQISPGATVELLD